MAKLSSRVAPLPIDYASSKRQAKPAAVLVSNKVSIKRIARKKTDTPEDTMIRKMVKRANLPHFAADYIIKFFKDIHDISHGMHGMAMQILDARIFLFFTQLGSSLSNFNPQDRKTLLNIFDRKHNHNRNKSSCTWRSDNVCSKFREGFHDYQHVPSVSPYRVEEFHSYGKKIQTLRNQIKMLEPLSTCKSCIQHIIVDKMDSLKLELKKTTRLFLRKFKHDRHVNRLDAFVKGEIPFDKTQFKVPPPSKRFLLISNYKDLTYPSEISHNLLDLNYPNREAIETTVNSLNLTEEAEEAFLEFYSRVYQIEATHTYRSYTYSENDIKRAIGNPNPSLSYVSMIHCDSMYDAVYHSTDELRIIMMKTFENTPLHVLEVLSNLVKDLFEDDFYGKTELFRLFSHIFRTNEVKEKHFKQRLTQLVTPELQEAYKSIQEKLETHDETYRRAIRQYNNLPNIRIESLDEDTRALKQKISKCDDTINRTMEDSETYIRELRTDANIYYSDPNRSRDIGLRISDHYKEREEKISRYKENTIQPLKDKVKVREQAYFPKYFKWVLNREYSLGPQMVTFVQERAKLLKEKQLLNIQLLDSLVTFFTNPTNSQEVEELFPDDKLVKMVVELLPEKAFAEGASIVDSISSLRHRNPDRYELIPDIYDVCSKHNQKSTPSRAAVKRLEPEIRDPFLCYGGPYSGYPRDDKFRESLASSIRSVNADIAKAFEDEKTLLRQTYDIWEEESESEETSEVLNVTRVLSAERGNVHVADI